LLDGLAFSPKERPITNLCFGRVYYGGVPDPGDLTMRILIAAAAIASMLVPAHAQMSMGKGKQQQQGAPRSENKTTKADEQAYKDALKRIPVSTEKPDPWKSMR
jgi:hypothetical protein